MIMSKFLMLVSYVQLIAISYVTCDIARSSHIPLSYRSLDSNDYSAGMDYQIFDDRFPRSDEDLFNLPDPLSATYNNVYPKDQTIAIRMIGDAVDIPLSKYADGLDKDYNFDKSFQSESTDEIRNFVNINTPPTIEENSSSASTLKQTAAKISANTTTSKATITTSTKSTSKITTKTPIKTTSPTITTSPAITTSRITTAKIPTTTEMQKIQSESKLISKIDDLEKIKPFHSNSGQIKSTEKKGVKVTSRSLTQVDDVISSNILPNGSASETDSSYIQRDNFEMYQKKPIDSTPDDEELQKIDESPRELKDDTTEEKTYEGWLADGTPIQCKKSVVPFLNCELEMFYVGDPPFFYYGLMLLNSNLADKVCPCPMPRLEPHCVNTAHQVARYMEHICHAYLRM